MIRLIIKALLNLKISFRSYFKRFYVWFCYGLITEKVKDSLDGLPCEIAYYNIEGELVGYWAYSYFDPKLPYKG